MNIEDFRFKDRIVKGITSNNNFKISVVKTTDTIKEAAKRHELGLLATVILGKAMTATMLLASELKKEERIQLRLDGNGPLGNVIAEANSLGEVRGYVGNTHAELDYSKPGVSLGDGIGVGVLTFTKILYNNAQPRVSTIEIMSGDITTDIAHYLVQSEQIPSAILLDVGIDENGILTQAGGLLLQRLPNAPDGKIDMLQERLDSFPVRSTIIRRGIYRYNYGKSHFPNKGKRVKSAASRLFLSLFSRPFFDALSMLSIEDLKDLKGESQEVVCHYCNNREHITKDEIASLITDAQARLN